MGIEYRLRERRRGGWNMSIRVEGGEGTDEGWV